MATDNRSIVNDAEGPTGEWAGSDVGSVETAAGLYYQGSFSISAQFSNVQEYLIAVQDSGGTTLNLNLSSHIIWVLVKDNLVETVASNGMQVVLGNGSGGANPIRGYVVGGNDNPGLVLGKQWYCIRLDTSNLTGLSTVQHNGTGAPTFTAIGAIGYGALHTVSARGNVDNLWVDRITYIATGSYAFTVNGGTSGTPITFTSLANDDDTTTNGWGIFAGGVGNSFTIYAPTEFGDAGTADTYFSQSDSQIFFDGSNLGTGNWFFRVFGNSTGTNSFVLDNCVLVSLGEPAIWNFTDTNINTLNLIDTQFVDMGTISFPVSGGTLRQITGGTFINCGQIDLSTMDVTNTKFIGSSSSATGTILLDTNGQTTNQTDLSFTSGGTGHAVYITATGSYALTNWNFSGYSTANPGTNSTPASGSTDAMIYNNSGGAVTLNITGGIGGNITVRNGASATTTVQATISITFTNIVTGTEVRMYDYTGGVVGNEELGGNTDSFLESITGTSVTFSGVAQKPYLVKFIKKEYVVLRVELGTSSVDITQKITQNFDRNYSNP